MDYYNIQYNIQAWFKKHLDVFKFGLLGFMMFLTAWNQVFWIEDYICLGVGSFFVAVCFLFGEKLLK